MAEGATVDLTDLPAAIPLLKHNLERNQAEVSPDDLVRVRALRWTMDEDGTVAEGNSQPPYDCLLGSDLLHNEKFIPHLVATTKRLLHPTRGIFILAVRWRKPDIERDFFRDSGLEWELITPSSWKGGCHLTWNEFGDPSNGSSNSYFLQLYS